MVNSQSHFIPMSIKQLFLFIQEQVNVYNTMQVAARLLLMLPRDKKMSYATN